MIFAIQLPHQAGTRGKEYARHSSLEQFSVTDIQAHSPASQFQFHIFPLALIFAHLFHNIR